MRVIYYVWVLFHVIAEDPPEVGLKLEDLHSPSVNFTIFLEEEAVYWIIEEIWNSMQSPSKLSFGDWNRFFSFHIFNNKVFFLFPNTVMGLTASNFHVEGLVREALLNRGEWWRRREERGERGESLPFSFCIWRCWFKSSLKGRRKIQQRRWKRGIEHQNLEHWSENKKLSKNNPQIALEIDYRNVKELEANDEEDVVLDGFFSEA